MSNLQSINYRIDIMEQSIREKTDLKRGDITSANLQKQLSEIEDPIIIKKSRRK